MIARITALLLAGLLLQPSVSLAQDQAADESVSQPPVQQAPAPAPAPQGRSVEEAYQREFAFLEAQRRELERLIEQTKSRNAQASNALQAEVDALQRSVVRLDSQADAVDEQVNASEEQALANADNRAILAATFQQAGVTLEQYDISTLDSETFANMTDDQRVAALFDEGAQLIETLGQIRREQGVFYTADGEEIAGEILRVGNIAAYGRGAGVSSVLAPAGGERLKVWPAGDPEAVNGVLANGGEATIPVFLFESLAKEVETKKVKTPVDIINDGGTIGWVIVTLGAIGLLLCVLRFVFLRGASTGAGKLGDRVGGMVREGRQDEALQYLRNKKSAPARVVAASIRNLEKDRDHIEDIVSEAILHESPHLNRFGIFILVIAAVAPLLGLLGTVTGMISTFEIITEFGTGDPKLLSGGIAIALVTTELGLIVAIPLLLLGNMLSSWSEAIKDQMEKAALHVINVSQDRKSQLRAAA
ncbi:MAG: MotA/TolQ/ExbB proton channel family protein [Pseudomonadota bacterium]